MSTVPISNSVQYNKHDRALADETRGRQARFCSNQHTSPTNELDSQYSQSPLYGSPRSRSAVNLISLNNDSKLQGYTCLIPIRAKPTTVYRDLGMSDDMPRSVAICPQRRCIAFGCKSGIELHWMDRLTGDGLNRWFPLAAPSDYLYFLPQKPGIDSATKLRLISSAAGPEKRALGRHNSNPAQLKYYTTAPNHGRSRSMTRLFFGSLPVPSLASTNARIDDSTSGEDRSGDRGVLRTVDCDHYCAIPLSDGSHMLFTDPATGLLCLGSDAPLGGPTKLIRKICMIPPVSDRVPNRALICYAAGRDIRWGVRVAAAYDSGMVFLYDIPSDCFERIRHVRSSPDVWDELTGVLGQSDLLMDVFMLTRTNNTISDVQVDINNQAGTDNEPTDGAAMAFRSLQIDGAFVCQVDHDVESLAVDCAGGGIKVWIFHRSGKATKMDIVVPRDRKTKCQYIGFDGLVHEIVDETCMTPHTQLDSDGMKLDNHSDDEDGASASG